MRRNIVAGNWKMNCNREEAMSLTSEIVGMLADEKTGDTEVILAPPFIHLAAIAKMVEGSGIKIAAQNCSSESSGAFTGEVSASMIKSVGCEYVIIGHSERRNIFHENDDILVQKVQRVFENNLKPVFCIGEHLQERESEKHFEVIAHQLKKGLFEMGEAFFKSVIIAYEPVWAIGTGITASAEQAQEMHAFIRNEIENRYSKEIADNISILYGGSCNEKNAAELFSLKDVDGGLIGGASLKSRSFVNIIKSF